MNGMRAAFQEYAHVCAQLRRGAEQHYHHTGDYTLIATANVVTSIGMRLERIALDAEQTREMEAGE